MIRVKAIEIYRRGVNSVTLFDSDKFKPVIIRIFEMTNTLLMAVPEINYDYFRIYKNYKRIIWERFQD
jgi:hypothetical protein